MTRAYVSIRPESATLKPEENPSPLPSIHPLEISGGKSACVCVSKATSFGHDQDFSLNVFGSLTRHGWTSFSHLNERVSTCKARMHDSPESQ